jgi:hypothetical protein
METVPLKEYIEAVQSEREKALKIASDALKERLEVDRQRILVLENRQSWLMGVGAVLLPAALIIGDIVGRTTK